MEMASGEAYCRPRESIRSGRAKGGGSTVYPASFEYFAPTTLDEALEILERYGDEGKVLAGGMSLIPDPIVRNLGTIAGSLAHADPQGDWGSVMLAVRAEVVVRGSDGERTIPIDDLFLGPFMTTLQPGEIVTVVRVPDAGERAGGTYLKLERKVGDFATAGVAVHVSMSNGTVGQAGIAVTGAGATNIRAEAAEQALAGKPLDDESIAEAARLTAEAAEPRDDVRGSEEYKRNAIRVLTARGLRKAGEVAHA